jgi:hypothetical protein
MPARSSPCWSVRLVDAIAAARGALVENAVPKRRSTSTGLVKLRPA